MPDSLERLEEARTTLLKDLAQTGDMRQGSITEHYRCCGKESCCCQEARHPGHGPYYAFTKKVGGKTKTLQLRPGPLLSKIEQEVGTYREFRETCHKLIEVNEALCDLRPLEVGLERETPSDDLKKKSFRRSRRRSPRR